MNDFTFPPRTYNGGLVGDYLEIPGDGGAVFMADVHLVQQLMALEARHRNRADQLQAALTEAVRHRDNYEAALVGQARISGELTAKLGILTQAIAQWQLARAFLMSLTDDDSPAACAKRI